MVVYAYNPSIAELRQEGHQCQPTWATWKDPVANRANKTMEKEIPEKNPERCWGSRAGQDRAEQERMLSRTVTERGPEPQSNPKGDPGMWLVP